MKVRLTFTEGILGTANANPDVHKEFIASKSADAEKVEEELAALPADALEEKAVTVFPRGADGNPILFDYQVRGFLKSSMVNLWNFGEMPERVGKVKLSRASCKSVVDNAVFVKPRQIPLQMPAGTAITRCTRPLRAETMQGPRVAIATSEEAPAGTVVEFEIQCLDPALEKLVRRCLDAGTNLGIGQWRNSGKGAFTWEEIK